VAVLHELERGLAAERLGGAAAELGREVRLVARPQDQRGGTDVAETLAGAREHLWRRPPVQLEDRPLRPVVEGLPRRVGQLARQLAPERPARREAHEELTHHRRAPAARHAVPAVARHERHDGEHREPLDPLGKALGEGEADRTQSCITSVSRSRPSAVTSSSRKAS